MYSIEGKNPTRLYYLALTALLEQGDSCSPRGKLIKELRPASVEFTNPYNRVTFLGGRRVNPFFQLAESLWILSGRADVEWLVKFNANMSQFSDDGKFFNAPYGERIRTWNKNALHNVIINPFDQLADAYQKLLTDKDTRQAVVVISNPMFDNASYTIGEHGKDIACNLVFTFKIRNNKLHMTVFNRSNDAHWGLWGANLCQFSTIQEVMLSWLKHSDNSLYDYRNLELGTYCQVTDSLHIYMDDYGAKCTNDVLDYYKKHDSGDVSLDFTCEDEPRMTLGIEQFNAFLEAYWEVVDPYIQDDLYLTSESINNLLQLVTDLKDTVAIDDYWSMVIYSMISYRLVKLDMLEEALWIIRNYVPNCQWKISMVYFLKPFIIRLESDELRQEKYDICCSQYASMKTDLVHSLVHPEWKSVLEEYLKLG